MMKIDFTGKNVLITGAGRGLGKGMAVVFADCGANVYLGNRKEEQGLQTVKELEAMGVKSGFSKCDVAKEEDVKNLVDDALKFFGGRIDVIVNAAGVMSIQDIMYADAAENSRVMDINVGGTANMIKYGLPVLEAQKSGNMITVTSIAGREGNPMLQIYCASKAAVTSLTQSAAKMAAPHGVRVNGIAPGIIRTPMWEEILNGMATGFNPAADTSAITQEVRDNIWDQAVGGMIPLGHAQTEEDIAWATVFLASDYAREITGQVLCIDGGSTMGR